MNSPILTNLDLPPPKEWQVFEAFYLRCWFSVQKESSLFLLCYPYNRSETIPPVDGIVHSLIYYAKYRLSYYEIDETLYEEYIANTKRLPQMHFVWTAKQFKQL